MDEHHYDEIKNMKTSNSKDSNRDRIYTPLQVAEKSDDTKSNTKKQNYCGKQRICIFIAASIVLSVILFSVSAWLGTTLTTCKDKLKMKEENVHTENEKNSTTDGQEEKKNNNDECDYRDQFDFQPVVIDDIKVHYSCKKGYRLIGNGRVSCLNISQCIQKFRCETITREFMFDPSTLFHSVYMSQNNRTISRHFIPLGRSGNSHGFKLYQGVKGNTKFKQSDVVYFEVYFNYTVLHNITDSLILEVGFQTQDQLDKLYSAGSHSRIIFLSEKNLFVYINRMTSGSQITYLRPLSSSTVGTSHFGTFGFYVNGINHTISCIDIANNVVLTTFRNVNFSEPLWPVFGVYNKQYVKVTLTLLTGNKIRFNKIPVQLFR